MVWEAPESMRARISLHFLLTAGHSEHGLVDIGEVILTVIHLTVCPGMSSPPLWCQSESQVFVEALGLPAPALLSRALDGYFVQ